MAKTDSQKIAGLKDALKGFNVPVGYPEAYNVAEQCKKFRDAALEALTDESESSSSSSSSSSASA